MIKPDIERTHPAGMGGVQKLYRFENGYGASVVRFYGSYGFEQGLWELAVLKFNGEGINDFNLCYDTPITNDVVGRITESRAEEILEEIKGLPKAE